MNERIEKMMLEATKDIPQGYYVPPQYFEKFAELIVRECAGVAEGLSKLYPEKVGFDVGYTMGTARAAKEIKERFGVEE